jgi:flavin reductase (DIM6/NTAB) family NADH-FMN oxidoreductase RutF
VAVAFAERNAAFPERYTQVDRQGMRSVIDPTATLWCESRQIITAGDHDIVIGEVFDFLHHGGEPLLFYRGTLGGLHPDTHMPANHPIGLEEGAGW